jgi:hypothetical protein
MYTLYMPVYISEERTSSRGGFHSIQTGPLTFLSNWYRGEKWTRREADHPPHPTEVTNGEPIPPLTHTS